MIIGMYVMCGGAIAFLVFATCLLQRLRDAEAPSLAINVAQWAGVAFVILAMAAAVGMASGAYAAISDIEPGPINSDAVRVSTFGFALWVIPAALAGATFIAAVSAAAIASGALPQWLGLIGLLLAAVALFGIMFLPTLGLLVWAVLVAIITLVHSEVPSRMTPLGSPG